MKTIAVKKKTKTIMACRGRAAMVKKKMKKGLMKMKMAIKTGNTSRNIPAGVSAVCSTTRTAVCMAWATNMNRNMNTIIIPNKIITVAGKATSMKMNMVVVAGHKAHRETAVWAEAAQAHHAVALPACQKKKYAA